MRKLCSFILLAALTALAFPGHSSTVDAQGVAVDKSPVSTNPEIAALQARSAVLEKQLAIINAKLDKLSAQIGGASNLPPPAPEPIPPPIPIKTNQVVFMADPSGACGQSTVSLTASIGGAQTDAACASATSAPRRVGIFGGIRARRQARLAGAGCSG